MQETRAKYEVRKNKEKIKLLFALINESRTSDKELSKILGMSQTTTTRRRQELEKEGYISEYTAIPNLAKIGIQIIAFSFSSIANYLLSSEELSNIRKWLNEQPEVLCELEGQGLDSDFIMISVHKSYEDYIAFFKKVTEERIRYHAPLRFQNFIAVLGKTGFVLKPFSFKRIESLILPPETRSFSPRQGKNISQSSLLHSVSTL